MPWSFDSFLCLEISNGKTEVLEKSPKLPRVSEAKTIADEEEESSPAKSIAVLEIAPIGKPTSQDNVGTVATSNSVASQEKLLSSRDKESGALSSQGVFT